MKLMKEYKGIRQEDEGEVDAEEGRISQLAFLRKNALEIARYPCYHVIMIQSFKDKGTENVFNGVNTRMARKTCPETLWRVAARKLDQLDLYRS